MSASAERQHRETDPTPMGDDPIELVRLAFAEACEGLERNATVIRAQAAVDQSLATISANAALIIQHERPRQEAVAKARAERADRERAEAERAASEKAQRVAARRARQAKGKSK